MAGTSSGLLVLVMSCFAMVRCFWGCFGCELLFVVLQVLVCCCLYCGLFFWLGV